MVEKNIALVGVGRWGKNYARLLTRSGRLRYLVTKTGCIDPTVKLPEGCKITSELNEVLNDSAVEGVVIAAPTTTHFDLSRRCIHAGKHVLVEKPAATAVSEFRELLSLASSHNVRLIPAQVFHYTKCQQWISDYAKSVPLRECRMVWRKHGTFVEPIWYTLLPHQLYSIFSISPGSVVSREIINEQCTFTGGRLDTLGIRYQIDKELTANILLDRKYSGQPARTAVYHFHDDTQLLWDGEALKQRRNSTESVVAIEDDEPLRQLVSAFVGLVQGEDFLHADELARITEKCIAEIEWVQKKFT